MTQREKAVEQLTLALIDTLGKSTRETLTPAELADAMMRLVQLRGLALGGTR